MTHLKATLSILSCGRGPAACPRLKNILTCWYQSVPVFPRWAGCGHHPTEPSSVPSPVLHALMTSPVSGLARDSSLMSSRWVEMSDFLSPLIFPELPRRLLDFLIPRVTLSPVLFRPFCFVFRSHFLFMSHSIHPSIQGWLIIGQAVSQITLTHLTSRLISFSLVRDSSHSFCSVARIRISQTW